MALLMQWLSKTPGVRSSVSGILGGAVMGAYVMAVSWGIGPGLLAPLELIAAAHPTRVLDSGSWVGLGIHLVTAAFWGLRIGTVFAPAPRPAKTLLGALVFGTAVGLGIWIVMGLIVGPILNPSIKNFHPLHFLLGHLLYGVTCTLVLTKFLRSYPTELSTP